ncbi:hypothetical protein OGH69_16155 [Flavobacterium sp. MFBS3-15]|uniref:hypothetical protein n=1 Tax=Flavobacterium sp. MFBS3-15 TaxID=2989816 RepID=UPI00223600FD|nr:hypothetical protein [Flavobacterium sp. MFBS3-15]MCW4470505.1 hypothetical protein [Flavobacterium sp. MFBS3-15]
MKKKILTTLMLFGITFTVLPQSLTCSCGSMASGTTIEYEILDPGTENVECCNERAIGTKNAFKITWISGGRGSYIMSTTTVYDTSAEAQAECCRPPAS